MREHPAIRFASISEASKSDGTNTPICSSNSPSTSEKNTDLRCLFYELTSKQFLRVVSCNSESRVRHQESLYLVETAAKILSEGLELLLLTLGDL